MNTICPFCGKDDTSVFSDTVTKEHGFHCESCNRDFGVDDGKKIANYEKLLNDFHYEDNDAEGNIRIVDVHAISDTDVKLVLTRKNKGETSFLKNEPLDFSKEFAEFKRVLFESLFFLDWPDKETGIITEKDRKVILDTQFRLGLLAPVRKEFTNKFPPYLTVLDFLFNQLFSNMEEVKK